MGQPDRRDRKARIVPLGRRASDGCVPRVALRFTLSYFQASLQEERPNDYSQIERLGEPLIATIAVQSKLCFSLYLQCARLRSCFFLAWWGRQWWCLSAL